MNRTAIARTALVLALALASSACSEQIEQVAAEARQGIEAAQQKLHEGNLTLGGAGLPKAEITPQGDLLINGLPLQLTEAQRAAVQNYRNELLKVTEASMGIGQDGIALAGQAVSQAVAGLLTGAAATTAVVTTEAQNMRASAQALCQQVERLTLAQTQLAAILPEFAPYARPFDGPLDCGVTPATAADLPAAPQ